MIQLSDAKKIKLANLFKNKKFSELELEIESISNFKERSSFLSNLLGIVKLKKVNSTEKDSEEALKLFEDSCKKDPNNIDGLCNFAKLGLKLLKYEYPLQKLKNFIKKNGYNPKVYEILSRIYFLTGEINEALFLLKSVIDNGDSSIHISTHFLTALNYTTKFSQSEYLDYCKKININFKPKDINKSVNYEFDKNAKTIELGFISPDFCDHSITHFLFGTLKELKNYNFKLHAFNLRNISKLDDKSKIYQNLFDNWYNIEGLSDLEIANLIKSKKIHVLIDLAGYFRRNRFTVLKYKPAPIQVLWLGYVNTSGIDEIDYIITDPNLIKDNEKNLYSEKIINLPNIWNCHSLINYEVVIKELPYYKNNYFTFGSFNNSTKISEEVIKVWSEILLKTKNSKLLLKAVSKDAKIAYPNFLEKFKYYKIDESRVIFLPGTEKREDHYKLYNEIDLSLDTFPYPGVTTSFESVWMGVPFLTMKGNNFTSRCGESININLDMKEFIAENFDDYINKAVSLSNSLEKLSNFRKSLRSKAINSPLFNMKEFGKNFSNIINDIWNRYSSNN